MNLVLYLVLIEVCFGMILMQCFIPRSALGHGFGKTVAAIAFFCLLPPVLLAGSLLPAIEGRLLTAIRGCGALGLLFMFIYFVVMNFPRPGAARALIIASTISVAAAIALTSRLLAIHFFSPGSDIAYGPSVGALTIVLQIGIFASGLLLGSAVMASLIGHWYLVIQGLSISWLKGACLTFGAAIVLRLFAIGVSIWVGASSDPFGAQNFFDRFWGKDFPVFVVRGLVGLVLPAIFCFMAYRSAAIRSTQSSTGILFPALTVTFIGEMIAAFLVLGLSGLYV